MEHKHWNSVGGALDNYDMGDKLSIDLGDTLLVGIFDGYLRSQLGDEIRYYIKLKVGSRRNPELISTRDYPEMKIAVVA